MLTHPATQLLQVYGAEKNRISNKDLPTRKPWGRVVSVYQGRNDINVLQLSKSRGARDDFPTDPTKPADAVKVPVKAEASVPYKHTHNVSPQNNTKGKPATYETDNTSGPERVSYSRCVRVF